MSKWKLLLARWGSGAGETDDVRIDASTNVLETIEYEHHEIHSGSRYAYSESEDVVAGEHRQLLLAVSNTTKWPHLSLPLHVTSNRQTTVEFYEAVVTSYNGTVLTPFNMNRNSANTPLTAVSVSFVVSSLGTRLIHEQFGTSGSFFKADVGGAVGGGRNELMLKQNVQYLLRMTNNDGGDSADISTWIDWYEHADKH